MAFCTHCGNPLPDVAAFCPKCGTKIAKLEAPTPPAAPEVPSTPVQDTNTYNNEPTDNYGTSFGESPVNNDFVYGGAPVNNGPAYGGTPVNNGFAYGGAPVNNGPAYGGASVNNGTPYNGYNTSYGGGSDVPPVSSNGKNGIFSKDTMEMLVQIAAIVFALLNVYFVFKYGIREIFYIIRNIFSGFRIKGILCNLLYLISGVGCAATAVVYFAGLVTWKKENASKYVLSAAVTSILAILGNLLAGGLEAIFWGKYYSSLKVIFVPWLKFLLFMILPLAIWIVLMYVAKINVIESINTRNIINEVMESVFFVLDELKNFFGARKASKPAPASATTSFERPASTNNSYYSGPADSSTGGMGYTTANPGSVNNPSGAPRPVRRVKTDRNFIVAILLSMITCGIYGIIFEANFCRDMNIVCDGDGDHTPSYLVIVLLTIVTCGIYGIVAYYKMAERIYKNGQRYNCLITNTGSTFLLWTFVGSLLCGLGPIIAAFKRVEDFNHLCVAYNSINC